MIFLHSCSLTNFDWCKAGVRVTQVEVATGNYRVTFTERWLSHKENIVSAMEFIIYSFSEFEEPCAAVRFEIVKQDQFCFIFPLKNVTSCRFPVAAHADNKLISGGKKIVWPCMWKQQLLGFSTSEVLPEGFRKIRVLYQIPRKYG